MEDFNYDIIMAADQHEEEVFKVQAMTVCPYCVTLGGWPMLIPLVPC